MTKVFFFIIVLTLGTLGVTAQNEPDSNFNYIHQYIQSEQLQDSVKIVISLPEDYSNTNEAYPVVFILDGKWFFPQGISAQTHFSRFKITPDLIIIGIENTVKQRRWYTRNSKKFNLFLEKELIPIVNENFRTSDERLLFGWEISGGFVFESLGTTPHLFSGYLAASPGPLDKTFMDHFQYRYEAIEALLKSDKATNNFLFFTTGESDYPAQYGVDHMIDLLKGNELEGFDWTYVKLEEETHPTTPFKTIHQGIEAYFKYYPILRYKSIHQYISLGGNNYLESYYFKRKEKYNFTEEKNTKDYLNTCKNIVFKAMSEDNYEVFDMRIKEYLEKNMLGITHYNHASLFATFYLKNDNTQMAMKIMSYYIDEFPEAARPYHILGNVYNQMGDKINAQKNYLKAVDLGVKSSDRRLSEYQNSLKEL